MNVLLWDLNQVNKPFINVTNQSSLTSPQGVFKFLLLKSVTIQRDRLVSKTALLCHQALFKFCVFFFIFFLQSKVLAINLKNIFPLFIYKINFRVKQFQISNFLTVIRLNKTKSRIDYFFCLFLFISQNSLGIFLFFRSILCYLNDMLKEDSRNQCICVLQEF